MAILKVKVNGVWVEIPALVGRKGDKGDKGDKGARGPAGQGLNDTQVDLLEAVLNLVTFSDATAGQTALDNLFASLRGTTPDTPTEPDTPTDPNKVHTSINETGDIFNDGVGYKNEVRINSSGVESTSGAAYTTTTGYIKVSGGNIVEISGGEFMNSSGGNANAIGVYGKNGELPGSHLGTTTLGGTNGGIFGGTYSAYGFSSVVEETTGVYKWVVPPTESGVEYIRISCYGGSKFVAPGANLFVTINENE
jgi:hypothetical protein